MKGLSGHGSLQQLLGRTSYVPTKRKRDTEEDHLHGVVSRPSGNSSGASSGSRRSGPSAGAGASKPPKGRKKPMTNQPPWDWANNKPGARPPTPPPAPLTSTTATGSMRSPQQPSPPPQQGVKSPPQVAPPLSASEPAVMVCSIARRHPTLEAACRSCDQPWLAVGVVREPTNPVDTNALQVVLSAPDDPEPRAAQPAKPGVMGYVPAKLARHLAPLMDAGHIHITARAQLRAPTQPPASGSPSQLSPQRSKPAPPKPTVVLELKCHVSPKVEPLDLSAVLQQLGEAVQSAAQLAASADAGRVLRNKMLSMIESLREVDSHVFSGSEQTTMSQLAALPGQELSLLLRLFLRKGPWFTLRDLEYREVDNVERCGAALVACGFLRAPGVGDCSALLAMMPAHKVVELAVRMGVQGVASSLRKADLDTAVLAACTCNPTASQRCLQRAASIGAAPQIAAVTHTRPGSVLRRHGSAPAPSTHKLLPVDCTPQSAIKTAATQPRSLVPEAPSAVQQPSQPTSTPDSPMRVVLSDTPPSTQLQSSPFKTAAALRLFDADDDDDEPQPTVPGSERAGAPASALHQHPQANPGNKLEHNSSQIVYIDLTADEYSSPTSSKIHGASHATTAGTSKAAQPPLQQPPASSVPQQPRQQAKPPVLPVPGRSQSDPRGAAVCACAPACKLQQQIQELVGPCVRVSEPVSRLILRMQRVYFLNEAHDMNRWVATERGALPYPPYTVRRCRSAFATRQALLDYERALQHAGQLDDCLTGGDAAGAQQALEPAWEALRSGSFSCVAWAEQAPTHTEPDASATQQASAAAGAERDVASAEGHQQGGQQECRGQGKGQHVQGGADAGQAGAGPLYMARFCAAWVYAGMCTVGVSLLEKARRYQEAVAALRGLLDGRCCPGRRGEWWLRLSIDLEHLDDDEGALVAAEQALKDPWVRHGDLLAIQRRVLRLGKPPRRWKRPAWAPRVLSEPPEVVIQGRPLAMVTGLKSRFYSMSVDGRQVTVEELALEHYASKAGGKWQGLHCEGGVWACLAGLLLWEELFADVDDVFRTPCQTAPLDLETDAFYPARRHRIDARLQQIADGGSEQLLAQCWRTHYGQWCRGVNWDRYTLSQLQEIARCVGGLGLSVVCRMLAEDYNGWRGGMPDLLLWRPSVGDAKLSEVKGPRDRLSDAQRAWMQALAAVGLHCEVLRVQEPSA